jgi:hypothetical protein
MGFTLVGHFCEVDLLSRRNPEVRGLDLHGVTSLDLLFRIFQRRYQFARIRARRQLRCSLLSHSEILPALEPRPPRTGSASSPFFPASGPAADSV